MRMPDPFDVALDVELVMTLLEMVASLIVPLKLRMLMPWPNEFVRVLLVMVTLPERFVSVPAAAVLKLTFPSSTLPLFELLIVLFVSEKFVTVVPLMPLPVVLLMFMRVNDGERLLVSEVPSPGGVG